MQAGVMCHLLTLQKPVRTAGGDGTAATDWVTTDKEWGCIKPLMGRDRVEAAKIQSKVTHRITLRWISGVTTDHRLLYDDRVFGIDAVFNKDERNVELEIEAVEIV